MSVVSGCGCITSAVVTVSAKSTETAVDDSAETATEAEATFSYAYGWIHCG